MESDRRFIEMIRKGEIKAAKQWLPEYARAVVAEMGGRNVATMLGTIDDAKAVEYIILSYDPMRMLSLKVTKAPDVFPFPNAIKNIWTVFYFVPEGDKATRVREVSMGFGNDDESKRMLEYRLDAKIWKDRYPGIQVVAPEGAREEVAKIAAVDTINPSFDDPGVSFVTVPGTKGREAALLVRTPTGTTLVLNDLVGNIRHASGFGGWLLKMAGFAGDEPHIPKVIRMSMVEDQQALTNFVVNSSRVVTTIAARRYQRSSVPRSSSVVAAARSATAREGRPERSAPGGCLPVARPEGTRAAEALPYLASSI